MLGTEILSENGGPRHFHVMMLVGNSAGHDNKIIVPSFSNQKARRARRLRDARC
jgi:hypothetical protein